MHIRRLDMGSARDVDRFARLPFELYRDCPQWVPPFVADVKFNLNRQKHPLYRHSDAACFVAEQGDHMVGRIAVIDNRNYNQFQQARTAFFYYLDLVDDQEVAAGLFGAAFDWARARGLDSILGPKGFVGADGSGLLVEGFEHRPAMGIPYNHAYYIPLVEGLDFTKTEDNLSGYVSRQHELPQRLYDIAERVKAKRGFWIKSFTSKREAQPWVPRIGRVVTESFAEQPGWCPLSDEETLLAARQLLQVTDPRLIKLVMKDDEIAGFVFAFPDLSAAIQKAKGELWPFGWYWLLREYRRTRWVNVNGLGLLRQYQGLGANAVLYTELAKTIRDFGFEHADIVQVSEDNFRSRSDMETMGVRWYKRHRTYSRAL